MDFNISQKAEVLKGKQTAVFKEKGKKLNDKLCFSITSEFWFQKPVKKMEVRTLDLLCKSEAERDQWANAFTQWREIQHKKIADEKFAEEARKQRELFQKQSEERAKKLKEEQEQRRIQEEKEKEERKKESETKMAQIQNAAAKLKQTTPGQTPQGTPKHTPKDSVEGGEPGFFHSSSSRNLVTSPKEGELPPSRSDVHKITKQTSNSSMPTDQIISPVDLKSTLKKKHLSLKKKKKLNNQLILKQI